MLLLTLGLLIGLVDPLAAAGDFGAGQVALPNPSFETDPAELGAWTSDAGQSEASWDQTIAHAGSASLKIGHTSSGHGGWLQAPAHAIPVTPGQLVEARVWARTEDATGQTRISLDWHAGGKLLSQSNGGSPYGTIIWRLNPIRGDNDWAPLYARGIAPDGCDRVRLSLRSEGNGGWAWFDDAALRIVPVAETLGELDHHPATIDPKSLRPSDYVTVRRGHLWRGSKRFRAWSAQGNLLALNHADMDLEVARFKEHGFNAHRSLWWSEEITDNFTPRDLSGQDHRDYLIACLGRNGLFMWSDMLNSCQIRPEHADVLDLPDTADAWREAVEEWAGDRDHLPVRGALALAWDPRMQKVYHDYIRRVLAHRNPYNGLTYAEDPTFFTWELTNEEWWIMRILWGNHLTLPAFFQRGLNDAWNEWLRDEYPDTDALTRAWGELLPGESLDESSVLLLPLLGKTETAQMTETLGLRVSFEQTEYGPDDFTKARAADVIRFLTELHLDYKQAAAAVFKSQGREGLGCQVVPLVYDTGYSGAVLPFYMHSFADATACGSYIDQSTHSPDHPTFPFRSALTSPPSINNWLDSRRVKGKPAFVYENMVFNPQKYRAEYPYRVLAWAAAQDIDVVDFHYYGHPLPFPGVEGGYAAHTIQYMPTSGTVPFNGCVLRSDEVFMAAVRAAGEIFKRGYLRAARSPAVVTLGADTMWSFDGINGEPWSAAADATALRKGFRWAFAPGQRADTVRGSLSEPDEEAPPVIQPTDQIAYRWEDGLLVIDDPRVKVLTGFAQQRYDFADGLSLRNMHVETPDEMPLVIPGERYVAIAIGSRDGLPLKRSGDVLVSVANTSWNSGFELDLENMAGDTDYANGLARSIVNHGKIPVLVGRVGVDIHAKWLTGRSYRMEDYNGDVLAEGILREPRLAIPSDLPVHAITISRPQV
ncbi:MAG TPA: hypothetical protein QGH10_03145 [Armatimonadota bacterium]|nr:hypothetical protein [Armatimonadota bacterium]